MDRSVKAGTPPIPQDLLKRIPDLKREFGDLFLFPVGDILIAYRPLTLGEFLEYGEAAKHDEFMAEDVAMRAIVYPADAVAVLDNLDIGVVARLLEEIVKSSTIETFEELKVQMDEARAWAQTAEAAMISWVCAAFPRYTVDDCYKLTQRKLVKLSAMAEKILGKELQFEAAKKEKKPKSFGMTMPPQIFGEKRASEAMNMPPPQEPRRASSTPPPPGSAPPTFFDFGAENSAMGFR